MKKIIICFLLFQNLLQADEKSLITSIFLEKNKATFFTHTQLKNKYLSDDFFVAYEDDIDLTKLDYTILTLPYILNIIGVVWISGEDYYIDAMDEDLYYSLEIVKEVSKRFYPRTSFTGSLIPKKLVNNKHIWLQKKALPGIAMPFSEGLDSVCSSLRHYGKPQLLITVRGFPDMPLGAKDDKWQAVQHMVEDFAHTYGHQNAYIWSNFHDFFNWETLTSLSPEIKQWRVCMVEDLGWIGLTAPIVITKGYKKLVLPGNDDWGAYHPGAGCPLFIDPVTYAGVTNVCDAFHLKRLEKHDEIARICTKYNIKKPYILGCAGNLPEPKNCGKCQKCMASLLYFAITGQDGRDYGYDTDVSSTLNYYKAVFNNLNRFDVYAIRWYKHCQELARKKFNTFNPELQEFFSWYTTIDFNAKLIPSPRIKINWHEFTDLYDIPSEVLTGSFEQTKEYYTPTKSLEEPILKKKSQKIQEQEKKDQKVDFDTAMVCHQNDTAEYIRICNAGQTNKAFFDFARAQYTAYIENPHAMSETPHIPKIIHQIWLGPKEKPKGFDHWHKTWIQHNPDWEYRLWTDKDVDSLPMINKELFDKETNYGAKSDIMRLEILNQFGGLYVDIDFECIKPIGWIHHLCDFYVSFFQVNYLEYAEINMSARMPNGIIASCPGHPLIKILIKELQEHHSTFTNLTNYFGILMRTGPDFVTNVLHTHMATAPGINIVFPANYFFSWSGTPLKLYIQPETLAIHHYTGSWG